MIIQNVLGIYYATIKRTSGAGGYLGRGRTFAEAIAECLATRATCERLKIS